MKNIRMLSRVLVGIVFVFSGFVKAVDPLGSTYKFIDYFNAFQIGFLEPVAFPLAILLSSFELVLGISLLLAYRMKISSLLVLLFMSFFTLLTFILALTNPVHDCGCFGDALILTNWQTFWKNIVIMLFTMVIFLGRHSYSPVRHPRTEWGILVVFFSGVVLLSVYCHNHLPILDFRPYRVGTYIPDAMRIPEGAPESVFETRLYYRNRETGKEKEFTMENFPRDTLKWEFVDAHTELISEGYEPPIHDFNIMAPDGSEITEDIIHYKGYTFFLVAYNAMKANTKALKDANDYYRLAQAMPDVRFFAVSSTLRDDLDSLRTALGLEYDFSQADEITLKTIVRSNPGLVLIKNGTIVAKWAHRDFPGMMGFEGFEKVLKTFPFCTGCNLRQIDEPPFGSAPDEYSTLLYYRNLVTDSVHEFTMDNFPANSVDWLFENSVSKKIRSGFVSRVDELSFQSIAGMEYSDIALFNEAFTLLLFIKNPANLSPEQFKSLNKFGAMAINYLPGRVDVYALTSLSDEEIMEFTSENIPAFDFYTMRPETLEKLAGDSLRLVLLENGIIRFQYAGNEAPDPEVLSRIIDYEIPDAETILQPYLLEQLAAKKDKDLVYIYILGFLLLTMLIRIYFNQRKQDV